MVGVASQNKSNFVTPIGALLLESYTRLPKTVQGTLSHSLGGLSPTRTDIASIDAATFRALISQLKGLRTTTVSDFTILDGIYDNYGKSVKGSPTILQGVFIPVKGDAPPRLIGTAISPHNIEGHQAFTPVLVSFLASNEQQGSYDQSGSTLQMLFGTQTHLMPLAPVSSYLMWIIGGIIKRAVIACPNGVFLLEHIPPLKSDSERQKNQEILDNVVQQISIVVDARQKHKASSEGGTGLLCRGASTVLVVLDSIDDIQSLNDFCANLGTGPYETTLIENGDGAFSMSSGLLNVNNSEGPSLAQVKKAANSAFSNRQVKIEVQSLSNWKSSPIEILARVKIFPLSNGKVVSGRITKISPLDEKQIFLHAGRIGLKITGSVSLEGMRTLKPGETLGSLEKQVERIVEFKIKEVVMKGPYNGWNDFSELDAISFELADSIRSQLKAGEVYTGELKVIVELKQKRTSPLLGEETKMPSGIPVIIPSYAVNALAPRLAVVLGILPSLGSTVRFISWRAAKNNGILL
jgi:hypothetical protein